MSSRVSLRFPDAKTLAEGLSNHPLLNTNYLQEKGITKAVAELAAVRFADSEKIETGVTLGSMLIIYDLKRGKDGITKEPLPNLGKLGLTDLMWEQIARSTTQALLDFAKKV